MMDWSAHCFHCFWVLLAVGASTFGLLACRKGFRGVGEDRRGLARNRDLLLLTDVGGAADFVILAIQE